MKVTRVAKIDTQKYVEQLRKGLFEEVRKSRKQLKYEEVVAGFRFFGKDGVECELYKYAKGSAFIVYKYYPGVTQVLSHRLEMFDEQCRITYEEKIIDTRIWNKVVYAWKARLHGARFRMMDVMEWYVEKGKAI